MRFEWDPDKNAVNIEKHGIDFEDARHIFDGPCVEAPSSRPHGEIRMIAVGLLNGREITVIYTIRGANKRIISERRARTNERKRFWQKTQGSDGLEED